MVDSITDLEGCHIYEGDDGWSEIKSIEQAGGELEFVTRPVTAESVPMDIRERAYDHYDDGTLILEGGA